MKKISKKLLSVIITLTMIFLIVSVTFTANAVNSRKVRVIVRNDTYKISDGAPWDGLLVDEWVDIDESSSMMSAFTEAINKNKFTQAGAENGFVTEINGIASGDNDYMSGWMGLINDWVTNESLSAYTVKSGKLEAGDEISLLYTSNWGEDLHSFWDNNQTTLDSLSFDNGVLFPKFSSDTYEYTLNINEPTSSIIVTPSATNRNFQVRTYKNEYTPGLKNSEYKRSSAITINDGDTLYIGVGEPGWASMNTPDKATVYTVKITFNDNSAVEKKITEIENHFLSSDIPTVSSIGGEWIVTGLSRSGAIDNSFADGYYKNATDFVTKNGSAKLDRNKSSENSRMIIALSSIGKDVTDICGYNLLEPLADFTYVKKQGINGPVWALIAFDTLRYDIPASTNVTDATTRDKLINYILDKQLENGGWDRRDAFPDTDTTAMALQALAPYYNKNADVKAAIDKALTVLSDIQYPTGGFSSYGQLNPESCAQVIAALTSLNINPKADPRFIKNGNSVIDAMMSYATDNGFSHNDEGYNQMATEQGYLALVAFSRFIQSNASLYDMTDLIDVTNGLGDVNKDREINILDSTQIQKYIADICDFTDHQYAVADFNKDGTVSVLDSTEIQKYIVSK